MKRILLLLILSVCLLPLWPQETVTPVKPLSARIDALIEHKLPAGSNVAISVYDLTAGKPLYGYQADKLSRPASTMKLLTTITALSRPEADEPFRTEVWYQGTIERDTLQGDMYVIGGYDPEFDEEALDSLVAAVARFPFSVIKGKVYGDVSMKDSLYWGSGWLWDDTPYSFQPYLSPLMLNKGVVKVTATPGERGDSARLECTPASSYYTLTNKTQSRTPSAGRFRVSRDWLVNGNNITVTGNVAVQVRSIYFLRRTSSCIPLWNGCRHEASGAFRRQKRKSLTSSASSGKTVFPCGWLPMKLPCRMW